MVVRMRVLGGSLGLLACENGVSAADARPHHSRARARRIGARAAAMATPPPPPILLRPGRTADAAAAAPSFADLGVPPPLVSGLADAGFVTPSPVQVSGWEERRSVETRAWAAPPTPRPPRLP